MITTFESGVSSQTRILMIEDNDTSRQLLSDYLAYHGWDVLSLGRGSSLLAVMAQFQPNLILLDLKLPDVDGYTLLQQIQQQPDRVRVPVIVISAFALQTDQQRAFELGAYRYLVKPVNLTHLRQAIYEALDCQLV
jgi:DNA-binding response OmpR family regulator